MNKVQLQKRIRYETEQNPKGYAGKPMNFLTNVPHPKQKESFTVIPDNFNPIPDVDKKYFFSKSNNNGNQSSYGRIKDQNHNFNQYNQTNFSSNMNNADKYSRAGSIDNSDKVIGHAKYITEAVNSSIPYVKMSKGPKIPNPFLVSRPKSNLGHYEAIYV